MAKPNPYDDEDSWWSSLLGSTDEEDAPVSPAPPPPTEDAFGAQSYVQSLIKQPLPIADPGEREKFIAAKVAETGAVADRTQTELAAAQLRGDQWIAAMVPGQDAEGAEDDARVQTVQQKTPNDPFAPTTRKEREQRVLDRYQQFKHDNPGITRTERDAAMERIAIEEGALPRAAAFEFARRLRSPREASEIGGFIDDARRLVRLADAIPDAIGPDGIPAGTLLVARKIVEAADADPGAASSNPRATVLAGLRAASEEAFTRGSELDLAVGVAVGLSIEPTRRTGLAALGLRPITSAQLPRPATSRRGGTIPHTIGDEGVDRFARQLERALSGSGYKLVFRQYERDLKEFGLRRFMDIHVIAPGASRRILFRYEIKTEGGKKTQNQIEADDILRWLGLEVNDVTVNLSTGDIRVNGQRAAFHYRELRRLLNQR